MMIYMMSVYDGSKHFSKFFENLKNLNFKKNLKFWNFFKKI